MQDENLLLRRSNLILHQMLHAASIPGWSDIQYSP